MTEPGRLNPDRCSLCGQAEGHSARCSVTRHGVPDIYRASDHSAGDFVGDRECVTHHACDCILTERDRLQRELDQARDTIKNLLAVYGTPASEQTHLAPKEGTA